MRRLLSIGGAIAVAFTVALGPIQTAQASTSWGPYQVSCATGSFSSIGTKADGRPEFHGTMAPCSAVPAGGYFALTAYQDRLVGVRGYIAARILFDPASSTYFDVPLTLNDGDRVCLSSAYSTRQACVVLHLSAGQWTSAAVAMTDPSVNIVVPEFNNGGSVYDDPKCGTCW